MILYRSLSILSILLFSTLMAGYQDLSLNLQAQYLIGNGVGFNKSYATINSFASSPNSLGFPMLPFIEAKAHWFKNNTWASNIGLGARFIRSSTVMFGGSVFYDFRNTPGRNYNQAGLGVEATYGRFSWNLNGYLPTGSSRKQRCAMRGIDFMGNVCLDVFKENRLVLGGGPYYYKGVYSEKNTVGGKLNLCLLWKDIINFDAGLSYDSLFKTRGHICLGITIPIGPSCYSDYGRKAQEFMFSPVKRAEIIVLNH